jgi:hypothetical protein
MMASTTYNIGHLLLVSDVVVQAHRPAAGRRAVPPSD